MSEGIGQLGPLRGPAPGHDVGVPCAHENVLALVLVFRVKLDRTVVFGGVDVAVAVAVILRIPFLFNVNRGLAAVVRRQPRNLQNKLAHLVPLRRVARIHVLPAQLRPAHSAVDVSHDVGAGDEAAVLGAADQDVRQIARAARLEAESVSAASVVVIIIVIIVVVVVIVVFVILPVTPRFFDLWSKKVTRRCGRCRHEIGAAMATGEPLGDDLGRKGEVGGAAAAA
ncbi:uncharacterized protein SPSK_09601 [Sporothrix schenckii 1099-18]|uniref:Uncharacterized protein n=1 Tax=Sporothrix schenckii 1099-18 TaxID=1397361 RepID=A0A0F2M5T2_SPOSC|nr:uncharacterized protein SPSK_09601 [Sporothrix schenckii 1099-18]KJR85058.1 hypothetical protein SPSK_09601 [Sporothrix schenckii 1099-18]